MVILKKKVPCFKNIFFLEESSHRRVSGNLRNLLLFFNLYLNYSSSSHPSFS